LVWSGCKKGKKNLEKGWKWMKGNKKQKKDIGHDKSIWNEAGKKGDAERGKKPEIYKKAGQELEL